LKTRRTSSDGGFSIKKVWDGNPAADHPFSYIIIGKCGKFDSTVADMTIPLSSPRSANKNRNEIRIDCCYFPYRFDHGLSCECPNRAGG
jgi:hypothetical protein